LKRFSVLDEDSVGADFLGEYRLKLSNLKADVREAYSVFLQHKTDVRKSFISIHIHIECNVDTNTSSD